MRTHVQSTGVLTKAILSILILLGSQSSFAEDLYLNGGTSTEINYTVNGSVIVEDANMVMYEPARILGYVLTGSGAVVDIYGGQIDVLLWISTSYLNLPEGLVTVYGRDFAVDGVPVNPDTTELFLPWQELSGTYYDGTPFSFMVSCDYAGSPGNITYQTVKLGWIQGQPEIELSQTDYDFGQVKLGSEQTGQITIYNLGDASLTISEIALQQDDTLQFGVEQVEVLPLVLGANELLTLGIFYVPVVEGPAQAVLSVASDDPNEPVVQVLLSGEGVPLAPVEQSAQILDTYEYAVEQGLITGVGDRNSAENKVKTFKQMLLIADDLLIAGYDELALETLLIIEAKCDGQKSPKDFIEGQEAVELNAMINKLIATLQQ